jgi:ABC-type polysaccharide/polyol phosphate transport system ATPase subunit
VADPDSAALAVEGFSKTFRIPHERTHTLKERALHPLRRATHERFEALRDVSFTVAQGEFFGVVGRNGSGKSTLLKCLAGIYRADDGHAWIRGRLSSFIELGVGFNMDLPARDNIRLNAVMLGLSGPQARAREDEIIAFAGLEEFRDLKIKNYSSGMLVRLGFSIMIHVDADVLLIDEVLAVGDAAFQQKCYEQFDRIRAEGRTVLFVTHDMGAVQRYCDRAVLLERGRVVALGDPARVAQEYLHLNFADRDAAGAAEHAARVETLRTGDGGAEILDAWFAPAPSFEPAGALRHGEPAHFNARVRFHEDVDNPVFGVVIGNEDVPTIMALSSSDTTEWSGSFRAGDEFSWWVQFDCVLEAGRYVATPSLARHGGGGAFLDRREALVPVVVTNPRPGPGLVSPPHAFRHEIDALAELERTGAR